MLLGFVHKVVIGNSTIAKHVPPVAGAAVVYVHPFSSIAAFMDNFGLSMVIVSGLFLGMLFRAGYMYEQRKPFSHIKRDMVVSLLIGGANFVLVVNVIALFGISSFNQALGIAVCISATGVKSVLFAIRWVWRKTIQQEVEELQGERRAKAQKDKSAAYLAYREMIEEIEND